MMRVKRNFTGFAATIFLSLSMGSAAFAQAPSIEEVRQKLEAAGMSPQQIESVLKSMEEISKTYGTTAPTQTAPPVKSPAGACPDNNADGVCDTPEDDPAVAVCRKRYLNIVEKVARDRYGDRLGLNSLRVAQTCSTAAVGVATLESPEYTSASGTSVRDYDKMFEIANYWKAIIDFNQYLAPTASDFDLDELNSADLDSPRDKAMISSLPRDLQTLLPGGSDPSLGFHEKAAPIHNRCENIRKRVGERFRVTVTDGSICLIPTAPEPVDVNDEDE